MKQFAVVIIVMRGAFDLLQSRPLHSLAWVCLIHMHSHSGTVRPWACAYISGKSPMAVL